MLVTDFKNSFLIWETLNNSYGRFNIDAKCTVSSYKSFEEFYLLSAVMACDVYGNDKLIYDPSYTFQAVFSTKAFKFFRNYPLFDKTQDSDGLVKDKFRTVTIIDRKIPVQPCILFDDVKQSFENCSNYNSIIEFKRNGYSFSLEIPIKHINIHHAKEMYQVETGPVLIPTKNGNASMSIDDLQLAFVAFNKNIEFEYIPLGILEINAKQRLRTYISPQKLKANINLYSECKLGN